MSDRRLRWGILGTGNIARQFADGVLKSARRSDLAAVGSRSGDTARQFAQPRKIAGAHGSYEALLADPTVDAIYNSLPNSLHHEWTIKALRAGKHVLCEKPFALTHSEAEEMFAEARKASRVLVEAFMYRSHPLTHAVIDAVRGGEIGELKMVRTSFCYKTSRVDGNVRFARELGGGGLMDVGCYCINFSRLMAGEEPIEIHASAHMHERDVDELLVATMKFASGVVASFTCGMGVHADNTAYVCGTDGYIEIPIPWKPPVEKASYTLARSTPPKMDIAAGAAPRSPRETRTIDAGKELYALEADDFAAAVIDGKPTAVTEADTLGNMAVLDEMRRQIGLEF
ncbi:MAG: D-xylose 1-dehydrogenase D-xylono,5-lactone-forming [Humisphaera sp.]|nr:D-xylose 1-dehydrogenase D-xylono,5-lactone-forming [Humisphaera sp.]